MNTYLYSLLNQAFINKKQNELYLRSLKSKKTEDVYPVIKNIHKQTFNKISCLECANCCRTTPVLVTKNDVKKISNHLRISAKQFLKKYILEDINGEMTLNGVPCKFLNKDNSCTIYEIRPEACRRYPHTDEKEYPRRTTFNLANTLICPAASHILDQLKKEIPIT